ncbi:riboflavin kinase [Rothia sp. AR01]|uniref:riboflavin kinase n=1 Tax=Rothia santali TaxID=2949643 RepID=A0A9X2HI48_9MICC|nr:riboflavin kinase [Rothia santali]MCP3424693.1 riboflavin kinase [Rothia santali]
MITITGTVASGDQRGRVLGFPTANIALEDREDLDGVWAGLVELEDGSAQLAAVSIGRRRTFYAEDSELLLEAHLIGFSGDLYGQTLRVTLRERLRGQVEFASVRELTDQMHRDVSRVLRAQAPGGSTPGGEAAAGGGGDARRAGVEGPSARRRTAGAAR